MCVFCSTHFHAKQRSLYFYTWLVTIIVSFLKNICFFRYARTCMILLPTPHFSARTRYIFFHDDTLIVTVSRSLWYKVVVLVVRTISRIEAGVGRAQHNGAVWIYLYTVLLWLVKKSRDCLKRYPFIFEIWKVLKIQILESFSELIHCENLIRLQ